MVTKPIVATISEELSDDNEMVHSMAEITTDLIPFLKIPPILSFINPNLHRKFVV